MHYLAQLMLAIGSGLSSAAFSLAMSRRYCALHSDSCTLVSARVIKAYPESGEEKGYIDAASDAEKGYIDGASDAEKGYIDAASDTKKGYIDAASDVDTASDAGTVEGYTWHTVEGYTWHLSRRNEVRNRVDVACSVPSSSRVAPATRVRVTHYVG